MIVSNRLACNLLCAFAVVLGASGPAPQGQSPWPAELTRFEPAGKAPVFKAAAGQWDAKIRERGWILKEGDVWKLWYTGYDGSKDGIRRLGLATSRDGVDWQRHPGNPLVKDQWVEDMIVVKHRGVYWMFAEGKDDQAQLLRSDDGVKWERIGQLDVRTTNGKPITPGPYGTPTAWVEGDTWFLLYERKDLGVWLATSKDMKTWTHVRDEPVLTPGPGEYDKDLIALNQVIKHGDYYYAYYHGCASTGPKARLWSTAIARSKDLLKWEKYPGNPLQPVEENKSSGVVVHDGQGYRLYTMHPEVYLHLPGSKK